MQTDEKNPTDKIVGSTDGLGDNHEGRAQLLCHGLTGTAVGYLREDSTVVFECDVCGRRVRSEVTREVFLAPNAVLSGRPGKNETEEKK